VGQGSNWSAVVAGDLHSAAIKTDGTLWSWGANTDGQLGDGTVIDRNQPTAIGTSRDWVKLTAGAAHTMALRVDGSLSSWGRNASGQLGIGSTANALTPTAVK
jgi:alpha-tubulin suppressor-like RCC1 family protein